MNKARKIAILKNIIKTSNDKAVVEQVKWWLYRARNS